MSDRIALACKALERYYTSVDAKYDALFTEYLEENGYDEEAVDQELNGDPSECIIIDFDDKFPFKSGVINASDEEQTQFIFELLKECWNNPAKAVFDVKLPRFDKDLFCVEEKYIEEVKKLYKKQCPVLFNSQMENDHNFQKMLAISHKIYKHFSFDYLQLLMDSFFRARIANIGNIFNETQWVQSDNHMKQIHKLQIAEHNKHPKELIKTAIAVWGKRICPQMAFTDVKVINASIESTARYIAAAIDWISNLVQQKGLCPFQFDLCVAFGEPLVTEKMVNTVFDDDKKKNDDDDDDDIEDPYKNMSKDEKGSHAYIDCVGKIEKKLKRNKLKYAMEKNKADPRSDLNTRLFAQLLDKVRNKLNKKDKYPFKKEQYPFRSRFVCMIDRRKTRHNDTNNDAVYMYSPPANCRNIPSDVVSGWFISSSRICLLPNMDYGDGKAAEEPQKGNLSKDETEDKLKKANIGSCFHCRGALLTLSFIAQEADVLKCYMYWNGSVTRFMPRDIKTVFPELFNMRWNAANKLKKGHKSANQQFVESKEIDELIERMDGKLCDKYFEGFQQAFRSY